MVNKYRFTFKANSNAFLKYVIGNKTKQRTMRKLN